MLMAMVLRFRHDEAAAQGPKLFFILEGRCCIVAAVDHVYRHRLAHYCAGWRR